MLSAEEKKELIADARNMHRRKAFARCKDVNVNKSNSLDIYIRFLAGIQKVFGPFKIRKEKSVTGNNKM